MIFSNFTPYKNTKYTHATCWAKVERDSIFYQKFSEQSKKCLFLRSDLVNLFTKAQIITCRGSLIRKKSELYSKVNFVGGGTAAVESLSIGGAKC
jgi:hypothetical protein